jgi:hypothetical protein
VDERWSSFSFRTAVVRDNPKEGALKRSIAVILASVALLVGLLGQTPASAVDGRPAIQTCSGPADGTTCWQVAGVAADVWHEAPNGVELGGGIVSSVYLYDRTTTEFFEHGVIADKDLNGVWHIRHFVATGKSSCGNPCYTWRLDNTNLNFGPWRILMIKTGTDDFAVQWDEPNKARQTINYTNVLGYYPDNPVALTSAEHINDSNGGDPMPDYHKNVWVLSANDGIWYPANGSRRLVCFDDSANWFHVSRTAGSGTTGDRVDYPAGAGDC